MLTCYPSTCAEGRGGGWAGLELSPSQVDLLYFLPPSAALGFVSSAETKAQRGAWVA